MVVVDAAEQVNPDDAEWIPFLANRTGDAKADDQGRDLNGELLLSVEVVPKDMLKKVPAGHGRAEPNQNPILPPPTGRLKFVRLPVDD